MFLQTFLAIRKNSLLAQKRNPMYDKNRFAKGSFYFFIAYQAALFLLMGVMLPSVLDKSFQASESYNLLNDQLIYILFADFVMRWMIPANYQELAAYFVLPIRRSELYHSYVIDKMWSLYNMVWLFFFIPFALRSSIIVYYGWLGVCGYLIGIVLLFQLNQVWFMFTKLLSEIKLYWALLAAILVYGIIAICQFVPDSPWVSHFTRALGEGFMTWNLLYWIGTFIVIGLVYQLCIRLLRRLSYTLSTQQHSGKAGKLSRVNFFRGTGQLSQLMNLELKLITRNKMTRRQLGIGVFIGVISYAFIIFAIKDDSTPFRNNAAMFLLFAIGLLGFLFLSGTFALEASYLDCLLMNKVSIYQLLRAKYLFYTSIATVLLLPLTITIGLLGFSLFYPISFYFIIIGVCYPILLWASTFHESGWNLNKSINKAGKFMNSLITTLSIMTPGYIKDLFILIAGSETIGLIIFGGIGLCGFLCHSLLLRLITQRWMNKRYARLQSFRNT